MRYYAIRTPSGVRIFQVSKPVPWETLDSFRAAKKTAFGLCLNAREIQRVLKLDRAEPNPLSRLTRAPIRLAYAKQA
jgi:hypothetical protein